MIYERSVDVPACQWRAASLFQSLPYLGAIEVTCAPALTCRYALLRERGETLAGAAFHAFDLDARRGLPVLDAAEPWNLAGRAVLASARLRIVVCGNVFVAGPLGAWTSRPLPARRLGAWLADVAGRIGADGAGGRRPLLAIKDLAPSDLELATELSCRGYRPLDFDPPMVLALAPAWRSLSDYVGALSSSYRREYRRARERGARLRRRELSSAELARLAEPIEALHDQVLARARLAPVRKGARTFARLRERLGARFSAVGYFDRDRLVAFNTRFFAGATLESHYFGMDYGVSQQLALYRNLLYDDIGDAIAAGCQRVSFGRGSHEIKSAMGAHPRALTTFGRHRSRVLTSVLLATTRLLAPDPWVQRHPFRGAGGAPTRAEP